MIAVPRAIRAVLGLIGLVVIVALVWGWLADYRSDSGETAGNGETTATVEPTPTVEGTDPEAETQGESPDPEPGAEATGRSVVILIEGLNFRRQPASDGELIRTFPRGTRLEHIATENGWYHVRDDNGVEGYVSASGQYTELQ